MKKTTAGLALATLALAVPAHAAAEPRFEGRFMVKGKILKSKIPGERKGTTFKVVWRATPACDAGPCKRVTVRRGKKNKPERFARSGNRYTFRGVFRFNVPASDGGRCKGSTPFRIVLRVVESKMIDGVERATKLKGRYTGRATSRRCGLNKALTVSGYTVTLSP